MHPLLERQLRRAGFELDTLPQDLATWKEFLTRIERSYVNADRERELPINATPSSSLLEAQQISHILTAMSDGVCAFNAQGQLLFMNPAAEHYLGAQLNQLQQSDVLERFDVHLKVNPDVRLATKIVIEQLADKRILQDHNAILRQGLETLHVSCVFNPIINSGQMVGFVLLFSDISDIKNAEADLIAAKEFAEKASHAKSQFLSSMSHELRTPMNAILGYSELLKEDLSLPLDEFCEDGIADMLQYVSNILQAGWHLLELINKVLDLTRIEAGKLEVAIAKVELVDLIKECASLIDPLAEKREITVHNQCATCAPTYALVDRARLKQVIINLLSNAVKYNKHAGTITIRVSQTQIETIRIEIVDTGIGLTPEQQERVFDPFTRLSGLNLIEGTGIGLTITKRLLELMDGRIGLDSISGEGSTFWIDLPTGEVEISNSFDSNELRKFILLYVEDSRTNVSLVAQILKARPDIALMSAHTGEMGLELAHMHHPNVILLDINLPGMDGFEVFRCLQTADDTKDIPVLALTAMDTSRNMDREAGFLRYIVKPLDIKQFLSAIDDALELSKSKKQVLSE
ncbi:MAG: ATP-binding protein [Thiotrichaceae bacterium]|nr:ATP-binding protein [Thiotrichaceae bacterium]